MIPVYPAKPFSISHSGLTFLSFHIGIHGRRIWPNEEFFARYPELTTEQRAAIRQASGGVQEEGYYPLGCEAEWIVDGGY